MLAQGWIEQEILSVRRACWLIDMSRTQFRYKSQKKEDERVVARILELKKRHPFYGVPKITYVLRKEGLLVNHKRVYRIMKTLVLLVRKRTKRKRMNFPRLLPQEIVASKPNEVWAMDFVHCRLKNGTMFRCFTVVDIYSRICPLILVSTKMSEYLPARTLLKMQGPFPRAVIIDNGPEFKNELMDSWSDRKHVNLHFIDPGKPTQNGYIESFNGRLRKECLEQEEFSTIAEVRRAVADWVQFYNEERPHGSLDYSTPKEFLHNEENRLTKMASNAEKNCWY